MENINLNSYILDTLENLWNAAEKFLKQWEDKKKFLDFLKTDVAKKIVLLIWWDQIWWSLSPFIHTYSAFKNNNEILYTLFKMPKQNTELGEIFDYIKNSKDVLWANVTMPYKIDIYEILKNIWNLDDTARLVWAVNTLAKKDFRVIWYNTDMYWIMEPIKNKLGDKISKIKKWYILWAWWAARAAIAGLLKLWINDITVFNRTDENMINLLNHFNTKNVKEILHNSWKECSMIKMIEYDLQFDEKSNISNHIDEPWILINTLPFWFKSHYSKYPIREDQTKKVFENILLYFDVVYDMNYECTPMTLLLKENYPNIILCDWIDMVVEQAKKWFEMWTSWDLIDWENIKKLFRKR